MYSKQNIPHFYAKTTIEADGLYEHYQQTKERFKCSLNDFVIAACARAVRKWPAFRSRFEPDRIVELASVNIGIAVGTDEGLLVPVLVDADKMKFKQLAAKTRQIIETAKAGKVEAAGQGVFTLTNLGMFGVEEFSAIINPPESAILAVGAIRDDVRIDQEKVLPAKVMTISLSVDHRVIDGVMAAKFLDSVKQLLENPQQITG
jgi:pyruvate dehydrogenase E2 component (dihydrolipoamide acetyltransferase)